MNPAPKKKLIPTQKTFAFLSFTPSFIIDWIINRWMKTLVLDQGVVPMLGKVSEGMIMLHYTYLFTTTFIEEEVEPNN